MGGIELPGGPPFAIRGRLLTPLGGEAFRHEVDGLVVVDEAGRIAWAGAAGDRADRLEAAIDVRPWAILPGLVDLHAHLPQLPNAGIGAGLHLLDWLERYIFPLERGWADPAVAERVSAAAFRALARVGTTTTLAYGAVFEAAMDAAFRAAEAHGIRAILGKVMMDRLTYDPTIEPTAILERSLRETSDLIGRWHGAADGRLGYAVTPRFAVSCTADMLRESARLAASRGTWWQTHVAEDRAEIAEVARLFPEAQDYVDVYDRAGGLGARTVLAHAVHLSGRELWRLAETGTHVAHCPASNLFLASGMMPLAKYLDTGLVVGLGSDVAGGPDLSIFAAMRAAAYTHNALRVVGKDPRPGRGPLEWLRMGTLDGARALGLEDRIGSLEAGKEADLIVVDPSFTAPIPGDAAEDPAQTEEDPAILVGRLIFRPHPGMVQAAWVRGRRLPGPAGWEPAAS
jgi:guanine deaminase